jgi:hypothetical protein
MSFRSGLEITIRAEDLSRSSTLFIPANDMANTFQGGFYDPITKTGFIESFVRNKRHLDPSIETKPYKKRCQPSKRQEQHEREMQ